MGLPGKPDDISGGEVEKYYCDGRTREIADYCQSDVVSTYRSGSVTNFFRGRLTDAAFQASETNLIESVRLRDNTKPHLADLTR